MKQNEEDLALLYLAKHKEGNWKEMLSQMGPDMLEKFEKSGYLRHVDDKWQITSAGIQRSLHFVFHAPCF